MSDLRVEAATAYVGPPPGGGDGVRTAPMFHGSWYILAGEAVVERARRSWRAGPGEGLILPSRWDRLQRFAPGTGIVSLGLRMSWSEGGDAVELDAPVLLDPAAVAQLAPLARAAIALHPRAPERTDAAAELRRRRALDAYAAAWLAAVLAGGGRLRAAGTVDVRLGRLRAELAAAPRLGPLDWARLRQVTGLSRPQLDRLSRAAWGMPVRGMRDQVVLARARELLADPGRNLAGIAGELGASDASHLVKWFRRCAGHTPGEERRRGEA